jgi:hypothetical protein
MRKYHVVKWTLICRPKEKGGLCIKDLEKMNISLLTKWWWKLDALSLVENGANILGH